MQCSESDSIRATASADAQTSASGWRDRIHPDRLRLLETRYRVLRKITGHTDTHKPWPDGSITLSKRVTHLDCGHSFPSSLHHYPYPGDRAMCRECGVPLAHKALDEGREQA